MTICLMCKHNATCSAKSPYYSDCGSFVNVFESIPISLPKYDAPTHYRTKVLPDQTFNVKITQLPKMLPKKVIQNDKATILIWEDGTKTVVKCSENDNFSKEHGFLAAYFEKHSGLSKTQISKYLEKTLYKEDK